MPPVAYAKHTIDDVTSRSVVPSGNVAAKWSKCECRGLDVANRLRRDAVKIGHFGRQFHPDSLCYSIKW